MIAAIYARKSTEKTGVADNAKFFHEGAAGGRVHQRGRS